MLFTPNIKRKTTKTRAATITNRVSCRHKWPTFCVTLIIAVAVAGFVYFIALPLNRYVVAALFVYFIWFHSAKWTGGSSHNCRCCNNRVALKMKINDTLLRRRQTDHCGKRSSITYLHTYTNYCTEAPVFRHFHEVYLGVIFQPLPFALSLNYATVVENLSINNYFWYLDGYSVHFGSTNLFWWFTIDLLR